MVSQIFKDPSNFPKLHELWLEKHCDLTKFLQNMISQYRSPDQLRIEFNANYSALTYSMELDFDDNDDKRFDKL